MFGAEAYWVKDRTEPDRSNCHICIFAKNENGRQEINDILSEANLTGFYHQPRIDISLIMSLPAKDVIVTTGCVGYWRYEDIDEITLKFHKKFKENFYLEVQYHNTEKQKELNRHILFFSEQHKIPLIMGCDSHYIYEHQTQDRKDYLASKGMIYPDEEGWYMDYPDGDEAYRRFEKQGILPHSKIIEAMENTNVFLTVEEYKNPVFTKDIKMPTLHPNLSQEEKDKLYEDLVWEKWSEYKKEIPEERWMHYEKEIQAEIDIVKATKHADYFLIDYEIVKKGKELGGVITSTGRGSGVSFITNKLLGFTDVDRVAAKVKMYPERFMSATRIVEAKLLADLDLNLASPKEFAEAQKIILGEGHSEPMLAYGTMKKSAAWKMYSKSQNVDFSITNEISKRLKNYEDAVKHADEEEKDDIDIINYVGEEYHEIYEKSKDYLGIISDWKIAPCSYLLYQGDIRREVGLIRAKNNLCCLMDGKWAEEYKFLKNDLLKVSVVEIIDKTYKRIGIPTHSVNELLEICTPENPAWEMYRKSCTLGINQVEQTGTSRRVSIYAPTNISELCAFIAAIRPGFKSMYKTFENRKPFSYGIKAFDDLIQTEEMPNTFVLYQEMAMATLNYAGIPMTECYEIIKNISKKRIEKVLKYKEQFLAGFSKAIMEIEGKGKAESDEITHNIWQILEDSSSYLFNASHSYSVSIDSLYGAYLKSHYPMQFYEVFLKILEAKGKKDRMNAVKEEAENYFNIKFPPFKYGQDNREISANLEKHEITNSLASIKGFNISIGKELYEIQKEEYTYFIDLLARMKASKLQKDIINILIRIDYFQNFGNIRELLRIRDIFDLFKEGESKTIKKEKIKGCEFLERIIPRYATDKLKDGTISNQYTFTNDAIDSLSGQLSRLKKEAKKAGESNQETIDFYANEIENLSAIVNSEHISHMMKMMHECEDAIKELNYPDFDYKMKMEDQLEFLGYIDLTTNQEEDRRKLLILSIKPLKSNDNVWGYAVFTRSIGTGKQARLTVREYRYKKAPLKQSNIVYAHDVTKNNAGYWYLNQYEILQ